MFGLFGFSLVTLLAIGLVSNAHLRIAAIIASVICLLAWGWIIRRIGTGRLSLWPTVSRLNDSQDAEAQYRDIVRVQLAAYLNRAANKRHDDSLAAEDEARRRAAEESAEVVLSTTDAPWLVELENQDPVRVRALRDVQEFIRSHVTSAIGISGPRGIGKTTIMRQLCARYQDHYVGVYVPAPVKYSPADFVRTIHQRTAEEILEAHGASRQDPLLTQRNGVLTVRIVAAAAVMLCAAAVLLFKWQDSRVSWSLTAGSGLAATAVVLLASLVVSYISTTRVQRLRDRSPVALARAELERLAWSTKTQTSSTNSVALRALSFEESSTTELVERESSHPQRVDAFQKFAALYRKVSDRTIIVAVDELDKISAPEEAIEVINGLKDLMHGENIHFLVSVSEDALARFALRGIPLRDAFDSTFDTIADVDRFSMSDASDLLLGRVVGMPQVLAYYCHALSGGIPRDLIRLCRECVEAGRRQPTNTPTATVVSTVTTNHVMGLLNGAAIRAKQNESDSLQGLLEVREVLHHTPAERLFAEIDRAAEFLWRERRLDERGDLVPALPVVLAIIGTVSSYFGRKWTGASWRAEAESGRAERITNSAASCMADASIDTRVAVGRLTLLRQQLGLAPLEMSAR
ncbi:P-loop NTPase fold protein [Mycobacterium sp. NPDC048908]|uniref:P-loop NTPase fold protein n=1 Tax=Mycobacterium sp. NPDC048908 TaxID=3364292 RepID=UPI00371C0C3B